MSTPIHQRIRGRVHQLDENTQVRRMLPSAEHRAIGPFVFWDHFGPATFSPTQAMDVRPHPHIGLATVTYLWEGRIEHRDSLGNRQLIEPGAVNWMTSGRGIVHSERTAAADRGREQRLHGLQLWVALPLAQEEAAPSFQHVETNELPALTLGDAKLRVVAGSAYGLRAPVEVLSELFYVDAHLPVGGRLPLPAGHEQRAAYVIEGELRIGKESLLPQEIVVFSPDAEVELVAKNDTHVVLLGGAPLDAPRYIWWNYIASDEARIARARSDWEADRMGRVAGDPERIPPPELRRAIQVQPQ
ncbi:MAG: pirin family protein [Gammaproteobacteria bacterium]